MTNITAERDLYGWVVVVRIDSSQETVIEALREAAKALQREVMRNESTDRNNRTRW